MTTQAFDPADYGDMFLIAIAAKNAGFPRVEIDPEHAIALIAEVERLRNAITTHRDDCRREYGNRPEDHSDQDAALWAVIV